MSSSTQHYDIHYDIHIEHKLQKSRQWVFDQIRTCVAFAKDHNLYVSVNAEDASRADLEFLVNEARRVHASPERPAFSPRFEAAACCRSPRARSTSLGPRRAPCR